MNVPHQAVRRYGRNAPVRRIAPLHRRQVRPPQRSNSTETAVEYNERERAFKAQLAEEFAAKRRLIHPDQPARQLHVVGYAFFLTGFQPVEKTLEDERLDRERELLRNVTHYVSQSPEQQKSYEREELIRGLEEWLERLEEEEKMVDDEMEGLEEKFKKVQEVGRMIDELGKFASQW